jgi:hypothetical protein
MTLVELKKYKMILLTIARAHSFIMKIDSGTDEPVTESM